MSGMDWDDLKFVLAVGREGGLAAAARTLDLSHSTAHRRLEAIERKLGVRLFERHHSGYRLTPQGESVSEAAQRMEAEAIAVERQVVGTDQRLSGQIRVSTSELLGLYLLPELLHQFIDQFPEVEVEMAVSDQLANLDRSDADVVIRTSANPPPYLVGRSVAPLCYGAYAHRDLVAKHGRRSLAAYRWIGFKNNDSRAPLTRWLTEMVPDAKFASVFNSAAAIREAVVRGLGASVLPCFTADQMSDLVRLGDARTDPDVRIWVLSHADLRRSARVKAFMQFMSKSLAASPHLQTPRTGSSGTRSRAR